MISSRARRAAAILVMLVALGGCGNDPVEVAAPAAVPAGLVPASVQSNSYAFYKSELPGVKDAFANAGPNSVAADGELWELRKGDRLVGALQLTTLLPEVDLTNEDHRNQILRQLLPTARDQVVIDDVNVWISESGKKSVYLWFGRDMYALMTLKAGSEDDLDSEQVLTEVVSYAASSDNWKPLYIDDDDMEI